MAEFAEFEIVRVAGHGYFVVVVGPVPDVVAAVVFLLNAIQENIGKVLFVSETHVALEFPIDLFNQTRISYAWSYENQRHEGQQSHKNLIGNFLFLFSSRQNIGQ